MYHVMFFPGWITKKGKKNFNTWVEKEYAISQIVRESYYILRELSCDGLTVRGVRGIRTISWVIHSSIVVTTVDDDSAFRELFLDKSLEDSEIVYTETRARVKGMAYLK